MDTDEHELNRFSRVHSWFLSVPKGNHHQRLAGIFSRSHAPRGNAQAPHRGVFPAHSHTPARPTTRPVCLLVLIGIEDRKAGKRNTSRRARLGSRVVRREAAIPGLSRSLRRLQPFWNAAAAINHRASSNSEDRLAASVHLRAQTRRRFGSGPTGNQSAVAAVRGKAALSVPGKGRRSRRSSEPRSGHRFAGALQNTKPPFRLRGCLKTQAIPRGPGQPWSYQAGYGQKPLAPSGRGVLGRGGIKGFTARRLRTPDQTKSMGWFLDGL